VTEASTEVPDATFWSREFGPASHHAAARITERTPRVPIMFRHRERFVKILIFVLAGTMVLSLTLPYLAALLGDG